jgi:outer membrane protein assembly factor BamB
VYTTSFDDTVRKIDSDGNQVWSFTGHTRDVYAVAVDSSGNVYSGSSDDTVRKIDSDGNQVWSFTSNTGIVLGVAVGPGG